MSPSNDQQSAVAVLQSQMASLLEREKTWVTRIEFTPVKLLVFGLAGTLLCGVVTALLALVIRHTP